MTRISEILAASSTAILLTAVTPAMANAQSLVDYGSATSSIGVPAAESLSLPLEGEPRPWVAAHRGQWRDHPENSLPAILQAARDGAEVIEIDIKRTKDGHLVLMHDDTVDRTTNGSGRVEDLTLAQIKDLRLRQGLGNGPAPVSDLQVPTFAETLEAVSGRNVLLNLDKGWDYRDQLISDLNDAGMLDYGLFKGALNAAEANEFMACLPAILWWAMHRPGRTWGRLAAWWIPLSVAVCVWWAVPLLVMGRVSPPFLDHIESAAVTTRWASVTEVLRGAATW